MTTLTTWVGPIGTWSGGWSLHEIGPVHMILWFTCAPPTVCPGVMLYRSGYYAATSVIGGLTFPPQGTLEDFYHEAQSAPGVDVVSIFHFSWKQVLSMYAEISAVFVLWNYLHSFGVYFDLGSRKRDVRAHLSVCRKNTS